MQKILMSFSILLLGYSIDAAVYTYEIERRPASRIGQSECQTYYIKATRKVRDQASGAGWCFAFAAADFMSFYVNEPVSAIYTFLNHNNYLDASTTQEEYSKKGGWGAYAIDQMVRRGSYCAEKDLISELPMRESTADILFELERLKRQVSWINQAPKYYKKVFKKLGDKDFVDIYNRSNQANLLKNLAAHNCRAPYSMARINLTEYIQKDGIDQGERLIPYIQAAADTQSPILINYDGAGLSPYAGQRGESNSSHFSVIVGRKWNDKKRVCEFRIRNTWGEHSDYYYYQDLRPQRGALWISEDFLRAHLYGLSFVKPQGPRIKTLGQRILKNYPKID